MEKKPKQKQTLLKQAKAAVRNYPKIRQDIIIKAISELILSNARIGLKSARVEGGLIGNFIVSNEEVAKVVSYFRKEGFVVDENSLEAWRFWIIRW